MNSKTRYIPLVIIGAILMSLLAIVPAFSADEVGFIDPGDISDVDGTLSDSTPDDQEWARQGGNIGLMLTDDGLDTPIRRVLIPSIDTTRVGTGDVKAHTADITNASVSGLDADDYILIGMNTVRKVESITSDDSGTTITVDKAFGTGASGASVRRVRDSVTALDPWGDNYASYATAEMINIDDVTFRSSGGLWVSRYNAQHEIADSDVARSVGGNVTPLDRLEGSGTGTVNTGDVLVVKVSGSSATMIEVDDVSGDRIEMEDIPGATSSDPLNLSGQTAYLVYWAEERNETGSIVTVRSQAHQDPVTVVLTETAPRSGEFALEIATAAPPEDGSAAMADTDASPPVLPVNPRDKVTLAGADSSSSIDVETTSPVFSGFGPAHDTSGRDDRPEVIAQVTDGDSGLGEDGANISVIFQITEGASTNTITMEPQDAGDVDEVSGGFEVRQRIAGANAPEGDATIEWWVKATDNAGNVGYSDRQASVDGVEDPCNADGDTPATGLAAAGCQPFKINVDGTKPSLVRAETGRHWDASLDTGDSDDKTEYRVSNGDASSVLVVFDEHLDDATVAAADFEVDGDTPIDAEVHNVTVRNDADDGDGNSDIMGDDVQDVGSSLGYVFLTVEGEDPTAQPEVELVGEVSDIAGNRRNAGKDSEADDRVAPTLTVTVMEGDRPVTDDKVTLTITSDENVGTPSVTYHKVMSANDEQTLGSEKRAASVVFVSATEYTATIDPAEDGLFTVYVTAQDSSGGNQGSIGDDSAPVDVDSDTSAILIERDTEIAAPDVDPDKDGVQDEFSIDDPDAFIRIDFSGEGSEYDARDGGDDLDSHGMVTIVSAMLGDMDISDSLQANEDGNVFLFHASGLDLGEHDLEVIAEDEAGNRNSSAFTATITITERDPYTLALNPGWNLVSIPGDPDDSDINAVIPADHPATQVLTYDPSVPGGWLTALRGADGSFSGTLADISAGRAYWINTPSFDGLKVDIPKQPAGVSAVLPTISIVAGWNLVPILDVDGDFELDDATADDNYFSGLSEGSVRGIYTFNTITNSWSSVAATDVEIGKGYWVYTTEAGVIVP